MRAYKAARRAAKKQPVEFDVTYEKRIKHRGDDGQVTGVSYEEVTEHFVCRGEIGSLLISEMASQADLDAASEEGIKLLRTVFWTAFDDEDEYLRFFRVASLHLEDDEVFDIMTGLIEDFAGRPTQRSSDSPATPSETTASGQPSRTEQPSAPATRPTPQAPEQEEVGRVVSFSRGTVEQLPEPTPDQRQAAAYSG